jgi:hypothetical protein
MDVTKFQPLSATAANAEAFLKAEADGSKTLYLNVYDLDAAVAAELGQVRGDNEIPWCRLSGSGLPDVRTFVGYRKSPLIYGEVAPTAYVPAGGGWDGHHLVVRGLPQSVTMENLVIVAGLVWDYEFGGSQGTRVGPNTSAGASGNADYRIPLLQGH